MAAAEMPAGAAPEHTPDWHSIDWRKVWRTVRRLQARIVKAVTEGRWNKVEALVYLLTQKRQKGRCVVCGQPLRIAEEDCQIHHRIWRSQGGQEMADNMELLHANCHRQIHVQEGQTEAARSRKGRW